MEVEVKQKVIKYAIEIFKENDFDVKLCKIDDELSYEQNIAKIDEQVKEEIAKREWEENLKKILKTNSETLKALYYIPHTYIEMVVKKEQRGLLLYGDGGLGKSFSVRQYLVQNKLVEGKDYVFICGHITPTQFYMKLYQARDKIIVFDDVNILENKTNLNMLKACLNEENGNNKVEWHTTQNKIMKENNIPSSFMFDGQVIILLNEKPKNNVNLRAVESRILHHHLEFSYHDKIKIIFDIAKLEVEDIDLAERLKIAEWIKENTNEGTLNLSIRLLKKCYAFYKHDNANWERLASNYLIHDEYTTLLIQGTEKDWCEATGKNRATYYRAKRKLGLNNNSKVAATPMILKCDTKNTETATISGIKVAKSHYSEKHEVCNGS